MTSARPVVAVLFGGRSSEHSISCLSAASVLAAIDSAAYEVIAVAISRDGRMFVHSGNPADLAKVGDRLPEVQATGQQVLLSTDPTIRGFVSVDGSTLSAAFTSVDVVFPVLHGPYGEDGTIQGALEFASLPCVGSGVFASAAAMDKAHMKSMFVAHKLPVGPFEVISMAQWKRDANQCLDRIDAMGYPVFVKPSRAGSSIGITKVKSRADLTAAIEAAQAHDPKVIVEASIDGMREIECGVLVDADGIARASLPAEIIVTGAHEFYDFDAKYLEDSAQLVVPAELDSVTTSRVQAAAIAAFESLDCEGFARCDFFVLANGGVIINEVNTLPGFTSISMFPRMWQATGLSYPEIVATLIQDALRRGCGLR
ncbi:MAG: hypothetical protein RL441_1556 [Actinomycetota bacterium]